MRRVTWAVVVLGLAALSVGAVVRGAASARTDDPNATAQPVRVTRRDLGAFVKATGVIRPRVGAEVRVGSRISGVVTRLFVQIGDTVTKGQLLATLDDRDLVSRRDEAAAALHRAEIDERYATLDLQRKRALAATDKLATSDLEVAERATSTAEQAIASARASLTFAEAQIEYTRIIAPISGVVASVATQEGETVAASFAAPTFLTLLDPSRLEVWAYVDETDIGRIRLGQHARFTVDTYGDHEFDGRVTAIYPKAEIRDNVVNYVTVLRFAPPRDRTLRTEMTTTVRIALESRENVLALPIRAVRWEGAGEDKRAFVIVRQGTTIERRPVTTGMRDDSYWEISSGVGEGDEVLVGDVKPTAGVVR